MLRAGSATSELDAVARLAEVVGRNGVSSASLRAALERARLLFAPARFLERMREVLGEGTPDAAAPRLGPAPNAARAVA